MVFVVGLQEAGVRADVTGYNKVDDRHPSGNQNRSRVPKCAIEYCMKGHASP